MVRRSDDRTFKCRLHFNSLKPTSQIARAQNMADLLAYFPQTLLQCPICYNLPNPKNPPVFCQNGHLICGTCKGLIKDCPLCRSDILISRHNVMDQILASVSLNCKYKTEGCSSTLELKDKDNHEKLCEFRTINCKFNYAGCKTKLNMQDKDAHESTKCQFRFSRFCKFRAHGCEKMCDSEEGRQIHEKMCNFRLVKCYNFNCQLLKIQYPLSEMLDHYKSTHPSYVFRKMEVQTQDRHLQSYENFAVKLESTFLYFDGKLAFIFAGIGIQDCPSCYKACLISMSSPEESEKFKCNMKLIHHGNEIIAFEGNIFSIDDTDEVHTLSSGGLIFPKELMNHFKDTFVRISVTSSSK